MSDKQPSKDEVVSLAKHEQANTLYILIYLPPWSKRYPGIILIAPQTRGDAAPTQHANTLIKPRVFRTEHLQFRRGPLLEMGTNTTMHCPTMCPVHSREPSWSASAVVALELPEGFREWT